MTQAMPSHSKEEASDDLREYRLRIVYSTTRYPPPDHTVILRTSQSDWEDVEMAWVEGAWQAELRPAENEAALDVEFKFVLNGTRWMTGWNQQVRIEQPGSVVQFNDSNVQFED